MIVQPWMKPGTVVRYVGPIPRFAGMEGYVEDVAGDELGVWWAPFRAEDRELVPGHHVRPLKGFSRSFARKYRTPKYEDLRTR